MIKKIPKNINKSLILIFSLFFILTQFSVFAGCRSKKPKRVTPTIVLYDDEGYYNPGGKDYDSWRYYKFGEFTELKARLENDGKIIEDAFINITYQYPDGMLTNNAPYQAGKYHTTYSFSINNWQNQQFKDRFFQEHRAFTIIIEK